MSSQLLIDFDGPIATVTINRPDKTNALSALVWKSIPPLIHEICARQETRVIIVRGNDGNFAAGADIAEFDTVFADRSATLAYLDLMIEANAAIAGAPVPVIAHIEGLCIGAGVAVALACDLRIADAGASFAVTPAKLGLLYSLTDTRRLVAAVGSSCASDLLFTGARIDTERAHAIGLVDAIGDAAHVAAKARAIASNSAWSHAHTKKVIGLVRDGIAQENDTTRIWFAEAVETSDFAEGLAAFRARRPAQFPPR